MVVYGDLKVGDRLRIVGAGAPGFAELGDIVVVSSVGDDNCGVTHSVTGKPASFGQQCGARRLERLLDPA